MDTFSYGFATLQELASRRVTEVGVERIRTAVALSNQLYEQASRELVRQIARPTTEYKRLYDQPSGGTLQPADPDSIPRPVTAGAQIEQAHPLQGGMIAFGNNFVVEAKKTVEDTAEDYMRVLRADSNWLLRHMWASIFYPSNYTFSDKEHGSLTIKPLANGDTEEYLLKVGGSTSTADFYNAQAAAIDDSNNPFPTAYEQLDQFIGNTGRKVAYCSTTVAAAAATLSDFYEDPRRTPDLVYGISATRLGNVSVPLLGGEYMGQTNNVDIVKQSTIPSGYMVVVDTAALPFLAWREHPESELQGFIARPQFNIDNNHSRWDFWRFAGFSPLNRIAAYVYYVGNAAYQIPTAFATMPLPI